MLSDGQAWLRTAITKNPLFSKIEDVTVVYLHYTEMGDAIRLSRN